MRRLLSVKYSAGAFNTAILLLRIVSGGLMVQHGLGKLKNFEGTAAKMMNFMGIGQTASATLVVFAEFFCAILIIVGLLTRLASIPLIVTMAVALFVAHKGDFFGDGQTAALFLVSYIVLLLVGPGRISADSLISK